MLGKYPKIDSLSLTEKTQSIVDDLFEKSKHYDFRCLLLLDPFLSPVDYEAIDFFSKKNSVAQVKIMHPAILANKRPLLIELNLKNELDYHFLNYSVNKAYQELIPQNLAYGGGRQYSAWLFSFSSVEKIAKDFSNLALQNESDGTYLLRFYDPSVFPQLLKILTLSKQKKLYGLVENWVLLNGNGELKDYRNSEGKGIVLSGELNLIATEQNKLFCIAINNQLLKKIRIKDPDIKFDECQSLDLIMTCLLRLLAKNILDESLLIEWGKLALDYDPDFDLIPKVIESTAGFTSHYDYYDWLNSLSKLDWLTIITEQKSENRK